MTETSDAGWRALGLSGVDERIVDGLVDSEATADQLAARLDRSPGTVRTALRRLRAAAIVERVDRDGPPRYRAAPPENALGALIARTQAELAAVRVAASHLQARYEAAHVESGTAELVEVVAGESKIVDRFAQLMSSATEEVLAFVKPPFLAPGDYGDDQRNQLASGVRYRVVYDHSGVEAQGGPIELLEAVSAGEDARVVADVPVKMFVVDRRSALVPLSLDAGPAAVVVSRFGLVDALVALFELVWDTAWPLADYARREAADALSERDRRLVGLMRAGYTDQAIARSLDVTVRTVARRLSGLMRATGATTRFQLGWRLAELERGRVDETVG